MIKFSAVCKYYGAKKIIDNANFIVQPGCCTAILGSSGSGKTTLLRMINGLEQATSGSIIIDGDTLSKRNINQIRFKVGFVFQGFNLFPHMTAFENICFAPINVLKWEKATVMEKADSLMKRFGLQEIKHQYVSCLSGGQQQRVAIIRTIMMNSKIILLDEPTSALDPSMINQFGEIISFLQSTKSTIVMVTHNPRFAEKYCQNIIFCSGGSIRQYATNDFFVSIEPNILEYLKYER